MKLYIEYWGNLNIKNKSQLLCTMCLAKYGSLGLYDEYLEKWFIIDHEQLKFDKNLEWTLILIPGKPDGTLSDHDYVCIHDDIFDRIQSTHQYINIIWGFISNETNGNESQSESTEIHDDNIQKKKRIITNKSTKHTLRRKMQKQLTIGTNHLMTPG